MRRPAVYIMASGRNQTLYTGVTANLPRRVHEHREGLLPGFTTRYGCKFLVWYEMHATMLDAIAREKQMKAGSRDAKRAMIEAFDPDCAISTATLLDASGLARPFRHLSALDCFGSASQ